MKPTLSQLERRVQSLETKRPETPIERLTKFFDLMRAKDASGKLNARDLARLARINELLDLARARKAAAVIV